MSQNVYVSFSIRRVDVLIRFSPLKVDLQFSEIQLNCAIWSILYSIQLRIHMCGTGVNVRTALVSTRSARGYRTSIIGGDSGIVTNI